jgi:hypothetical protein
VKLVDDLRNPQPERPVESLGRPEAGFTWKGIYGIAGAILFAFLLPCAASIVINVTRALFDPSVIETPPPPSTTYYNIYAVLAALGVMIGFTNTILAARIYNLKRDLGYGRPRFGWRILLSPRGLARFLFTPIGVYDSDRQHGRLLRQLSFARGALGLIVIVSVVVYYQQTTFNSYTEALTVQVTNTVLIAAAVVLLCCLASIALVSSANRGLALRATLRPLRAIFIAAAGTTAVLLYSAYSREQNNGVQQGDIRELPLAIGLNPHLVWLILFLAFSVYYINKSMFNVADAHPYLAPVATIAVVWTLIGLSALARIGIRLPFLSEEVILGIPRPLELLLSLGGALTTTALCLWELFQLRREGPSFRTGPWR